MMIRGKPFVIDQRKFYLIAVAAFGIVAVMNTATLLQTYNYLLLTDLISGIASNIFNYALWGFFVYLYRQLPPKDVVVAKKEEMEDMLLENEKELNKGFS